MGKLILVSREEVCEISNTKAFEMAMSNEDLKEIYFDAFLQRRIQEILDELCEDGLIRRECEDEEGYLEQEEDLRYTFKYLDKLVQQRLGAEYDVFKEWCEDELNRRLENMCRN